RTYFKLDVYLHVAEADWLVDPSLNGSLLFIGEEIKTERAEYFLKPGPLKISSFACEVIHTPGHSPGSMSFIFPEEKLVIGGDVLFHSGIGRTDLPGGNQQQLVHSIRNQFYTL